MKLLSFLYAAYFFIGVNGQDACNITVGGGPLRGLSINSDNSSRKVCAYIGIPFAAPPLGNLRFREPQPAQPWGAAGFNATSRPNWCPQPVASKPQGVNISEDCLKLNVFVPQNTTSSANLSVMIWFHGGGFTSGSADYYGPQKLLARGDIILVTAHYRLGLIGFLSTGDSLSPGNYGLKDQHFAIKWVRDNIASFGGNSGKITIFGESAGGASTTFQLITPLNIGLINGAIAQSGTALSTWAIDPNPKQSAMLMAKRLGCPDVSWSWLIVLCLRLKPWQQIVTEQWKYTMENYWNLTYPYATVTPVVEPESPTAFITKTPLEIIKSGNFSNVPVMLGANKHEGSFILGTLYATTFGPRGRKNDSEYLRNQIVPDLLQFFGIYETPGNRAVASSMELAYLNGVNRSNWEASMPGLIDMLSVLTFKSSIQETADALSRRNRSVYLYSFEHHSSNSLASMVYPPDYPVTAGITHADELMYLFNLFPASMFSGRDLAYSDMMVDMWLNFGKLGNPTPFTDPRFDNWATYNTKDEAFMKLNVSSKLLHGYRSSWRPNGFEWN